MTYRNTSARYCVYCISCRVNERELIIGDSISATDVQGFFAFSLNHFKDMEITDEGLYKNTYL